MEPVREPLEVGGRLADEERRQRLADDGADRRRRAERERLAQPTRPSSVVTRTRICFPSRAVHGDGGSIAFQGIPRGTASTVAIVMGGLRAPSGRAAPRPRREYDRRARSG